MTGKFIIQIPEFSFLLEREALLKWELYGADKKGSYQKLKWEVTSSASLERVQNRSESAAISAAINMSAREITFSKGEMTDGEFTRLLQYLLHRSYFHVRPGVINYIAHPKNRHRDAEQKER